MPRVDHEKLLEHIREKAGRVKCTICRRGPMYFSDSVSAVPEAFDLPGLNHRAQRAVVTLVCNNCGGVSFIDPLAAGVGIIEDDEPEGEIIYLK